MPELRPATKAVHLGRPPREPDQPFNTPITMASTYVAGGDLEYGRYGNPTWSAFEEALGGLEGGRCLAFSSGLAAVATILDLVGTGQKVVAPRHAYNGSVMQLADLELRERIKAHLVDVTDTDAVRAACHDASLVWLESPTNPGRQHRQCADKGEISGLPRVRIARRAEILSDGARAISSARSLSFRADFGPIPRMFSRSATVRGAHRQRSRHRRDAGRRCSPEAPWQSGPPASRPDAAAHALPAAAREPSSLPCGNGVPFAATAGLPAEPHASARVPTDVTPPGQKAGRGLIPDPLPQESLSQGVSIHERTGATASILQPRRCHNPRHLRAGCRRPAKPVLAGTGSRTSLPEFRRNPSDRTALRRTSRPEMDDLRSTALPISRSDATGHPATQIAQIGAHRSTAISRDQPRQIGGSLAQAADQPGHLAWLGRAEATDHAYHQPRHHRRCRTMQLLSE